MRDRSQCCYAFRVNISISSVRCLKKWSLGGNLADTHPTVPRVVRSLNRLSLRRPQEGDRVKAYRLAISVTALSPPVLLSTYVEFECTFHPFPAQVRAIATSTSSGTFRRSSAPAARM